jgi:hypothetical protein
MKKLIACLLLAGWPLLAGVNKPFPAHWGEPPKIQTMDMVPLPEGYGTGSSTLRTWIVRNLEKDAQGGAKGGASPAELASVYTQDFEKLPPGPLPDGQFVVLAGDFVVKEVSGTKFLELPGAPLDTFSVLFGPVLAVADASISARIYGTTKSRRQPTFGVGLGGASPWKLVIAPGKGAVEIWRDDQFKASAPWNWKSGMWTALKLDVRKGQAGDWLVRGKAWDGAASEPVGWTVETTTSEPPPAGRASAWGSPFAGTPIQYDDLVVRGTVGK